MWDRGLATVRSVKEGIATIIVKGSFREEGALRWELGGVVEEILVDWLFAG